MTNSVFHSRGGADGATAEGSLEFGRFRVLLRQRLLLADDVPIELGTRPFDLLLALLEANGSLVSKEQLLARVWPGITVAQDVVKVHVSALRKALGEDRDFIHTEVGRGYRFTAAVRSTDSRSPSQPPMRRRCCSEEVLFPRPITRRPLHGWSVKGRFDRHTVPTRPESAAAHRQE